ncbi:MAG: hypothetical protein LC667_16450 [Thioalkalivibrio sp.]|nr:hypothetical protein [Thioalkalivibrio sp.]
MADRPLTIYEKAALIGVMVASPAAALLLTTLGPLEAIGSAALIGLLAFAVALALGRGPRAGRGSIGILIALSPESESLDAQIRADFVNELRRLIDAYATSRPLELVEYSLGQALDRVFPSQLQIAVEGDFLGFALASRLVLVAAQYALGVVAVISRDLDFAEECFENIQAAIRQLPRDRPPASYLLPAVKQHLVDIHGMRAARGMALWARSREKAALAAAEVHVDNVLRLLPSSEAANLSKAIISFVLRRDVVAAKRCIKKCSGSATATWRYSDAFLSLYEGRIDRARAAYRKAARTPSTEVSDYLQSEQFMVEVLKEEPDRFQLWFGIGAINLLVKEDIPEATEAFERFKSADTENKYRVFHDWAEAQVNLAKGALDHKA